MFLLAVEAVFWENGPRVFSPWCGPCCRETGPRFIDHCALGGRTGSVGGIKRAKLRYVIWIYMPRPMYVYAVTHESNASISLSVSVYVSVSVSLCM